MTSARLVETIAESFGQRLTEAKRSGSTTFLSTPDDFLYAFVEEPAHMTEPYLSAMVKKGLKDFKHIVVLTSGQIPSAVRTPLTNRKVTVVEGARFQHLLEILGVDTIAAPETPAPASIGEHRTLPTADRLDRLMHVGREWLGQGVPALAARFYSEAVSLKPEYIPAYLGLGESYLALGLGDMAREAFDTVLTLQEDNMQARVGKARAHGVHGKIQQEIRALKSILADAPGNAVVRTHLFAALVEAQEWAEAGQHVEELLRLAPGEGRFHAMWAACLWHTGDREGAAREEAVALSTGLPMEEVLRVYETMMIQEKTLQRGKERPKSVTLPPIPAPGQKVAAPAAPPPSKPAPKSRPAKAKTSGRRK